MQFHFFQFWFFLNPYFSKTSIIMCLEIKGYSLIIGWEGCIWLVVQLDVRLPPTWVHIFLSLQKLLTPSQLAHVLFKDIAWPASSSLLLIEVKSCWSSKCPKMFDPLPGLLPHPVINEWSHKEKKIIRYIQPPAPLIACEWFFLKFQNKTFFSATARDAAKLTAVVVLPTPPFWFAIAIISLI